MIRDATPPLMLIISPRMRYARYALSRDAITLLLYTLFMTRGAANILYYALFILPMLLLARCAGDERATLRRRVTPRMLLSSRHDAICAMLRLRTRQRVNVDDARFTSRRTLR